MDKSAIIRCENKCYDPFKIHKRKVRVGLRVISEEYADKNQQIKLIPGKKICCWCRKKISNSPPTSAEDQPQSSGNFVDTESELQLLNESLSIIGESPFKHQKLKKHSSYEKKKNGKNKGNSIRENQNDFTKHFS